MSDAHAAKFDRALRLRDAGNLDGAVALLREVVAADSIDQRLHAHALVQLGNVLGKLGRHDEAVAPFRAATETAPRMELASLALFHALDRLGERTEALCEAFRLLTLRESLCYRELFAGDTFRGADDEALELAEQARVLLAAHRDAQRRRVRPMPGDTVRVRPTEAAAARPGSLATLRGINGQIARLVFSDGEHADVDIARIDHHEI